VEIIDKVFTSYEKIYDKFGIRFESKNDLLQSLISLPHTKVKTSFVCFQKWCSISRVRGQVAIYALQHERPRKELVSAPGMFVNG
jgi:hypothetical protein